MTLHKTMLNMQLTARTWNAPAGVPSWRQGSISKLEGEVMEVMVVMEWEVMNSCSNGSHEVEIGLQNDHVVMIMAHGVIM
jgi:hypothetical protein